MRIRAVINDTYTGCQTISDHEVATFTPEALREIIVRENQEQVGADQYDGSGLALVAGGVDTGVAWATLREGGGVHQAPWLIFIHAYPWAEAPV